jgi:hypothetical protein
LLVENSDNLSKLKSIIVKLPKSEKGEALLWSTERDFLKGVEILLEYKADVNAQDEAKRTALHLSIMGNYRDITFHLLKHPNIRVDIEDSYKRTPLHYATRNGDLEVMKKLVEIQYKRRSVLTSWIHFINIVHHFMNISNLLHPIKAYEGFKLKYCHEYINAKDVLDNNAFKYALMIDHEDATKIQIFLLNHGGVPNEKLNFIESAALMGLQMFLGQVIVNTGIKTVFCGLNIAVGVLDGLLMPPPPPAPPPDSIMTSLVNTGIPIVARMNPRREYCQLTQRNLPIVGSIQPSILAISREQLDRTFTI